MSLSSKEKIRGKSKDSMNTDPTELKNFVFNVSLKQQTKKGVEPIFENTKVYFTKDNNKPFKYYLNIENDTIRTRSKKSAPYIKVLISEELDFSSSSSESPHLYQVNFSFLYKKSRCIIEFRDKARASSESFEFRNILCKLLYQTKNQKVSKGLQSFEEEAQMVSLSQQTKQQQKTEDSPTKKLKKEENFSEVKSKSLNKMKKEKEFTATKKEYSSIKKTYQKQISTQSITKKMSGSFKSAQGSFKTESEFQSCCSFKTPKRLIKHESVDHSSQIVNSFRGNFYYLDDSYQFVKLAADVMLNFIEKPKNPFLMEIINSQNQKVLYSKPLTKDTNYYLDLDNNLFKWVDLNESVMQVLAIKLLPPSQQTNKKGKNAKIMTVSEYNDDLKKLKAILTQCVYEEKIRIKDSMTYKSEASICSETKSIQCYREEENMVDESQGTRSLKICKILSFFEYNDGLQHTTMAQAKLLDRLFVSRGPIVSVFRTTDDNKNDCIEFICNLPDLNNIYGELISPKKMFFYDDDSKIYLMNAESDKKGYSLDLEKGIISEEFVIDGVNRIFDVGICKGLNENNELYTQFIGINQNNIIQFDLMVEDELKQVLKKKYTKSPKFTCILTTYGGNFLIGSSKGEVRLFDKVGKNAKNVIKCGDMPIIALEISKDDQWVVAVSEKSLYLFPTESNGVKGLQKTFGKDNKPNVIELKISGEDERELDLGKSVMKKAIFLYKEDGVTVRGVLTYMNKCLLLWELEDILENKLFEYKSKKMRESIIDLDYQHMDYNKIILMLPNELLVFRI